jgi:hypothetical protein
MFRTSGHAITVEGGVPRRLLQFLKRGIAAASGLRFFSIIEHDVV